MAKVLGIGSALIDLMVNVSDEFLLDYCKKTSTEKGGRVLLSENEMQELYQSINLYHQGEDKIPVPVPGGSCANTLIGLANLGVETKFIAKLGDDKQGKLYLDDLTASNVDISSIKFDEKEHTGSCFSLITDDSQRTMRTFLGASGKLIKKDILAEDFAGCTHVFLEGYFAGKNDFLKHCFDLASKNNMTIIFTLASKEIVEKNRAQFLRLFKKYKPIILGNLEEVLILTKKKNLESAITEMLDYSSVVAVTLGADGAFVATAEEQVKSEAQDVDVVDTTGAGDLWASGFLCGLIKGLDLVDSSKLASESATIAIQQYGARSDTVYWEKLRLEFLI